MPRPIKSRSVSESPRCRKFYPEAIMEQDSVTLSLDEYEVIRNCDFGRLSQENCAKLMDISRTTVQRIYASARMKIAEAIVLAKVLEIEGGSVNMSEQKNSITGITNAQGEISMKLAIGLDGMKVAGHFGQCNDFRIIEIVDNEIRNQNDIHDEVHVHQQRPQFLKDLGVDILIMNTMGKGAYNRLLNLGIQCIFAENKTVEEAVAAYLNKTLTTPLEAHECNHHGEHHHHG